VWREYHPSLPLQNRTSPRLIKQTEESRAWTLNYEPSLRGKPASLIFPFQPFTSSIKHI
jgi:hypothetical protein